MEISHSVPCPSESNICLKQWENEVAWFELCSTPHSTLSEARAGSGRACFKRILVSDHFIFISTSTPAGRFKFVSAPMIFGFGFRMSMRRLCTRISYCSRAFLCTKLERFTVYLWTSVGKGVGPAISAPFRTAISTICFAELSMIFES